jgi:hypothetical protein
MKTRHKIRIAKALYRAFNVGRYLVGILLIVLLGDWIAWRPPEPIGKYYSDIFVTGEEYIANCDGIVEKRGEHYVRAGNRYYGLTSLADITPLPACTRAAGVSGSFAAQ